MKIRYDLDDGYAGPSRPHFVEVSDEDLAECETEEEKAAMVDEAIQEDFQQHIFPVYKNPFGK